MVDDHAHVAGRVGAFKLDDLHALHVAQGRPAADTEVDAPRGESGEGREAGLERVLLTVDDVVKVGRQGGGVECGDENVARCHRGVCHAIVRALLDVGPDACLEEEGADGLRFRRGGTLGGVEGLAV